ncbi:MAG: sugar ABC transporter substrate-binding protein [Gemmatimonadetes bacterium]|nr:sugar ABC transporter substrate-binding protein [Gemmatimonadota bacterium]
MIPAIRRGHHAGLLRLLAGLLAAVGCAGDGSDCVRVVSWADYREIALEEEIADSFAVRFPSIPVCFESLSGAGIYREKVLTSMAAGTPPGVFLLDGIDIPAFANRGVLLDLTPFAARAGVDTSAFHPRLRELFRPHGRWIAFPKGFTPMVLYYNRNVFDTAGVPYPREGWTWDDFVGIARSLTADTDGDGTINRWGFGWPREFFYLQSWLWAGGGDLITPEGTRASGALDSPATVRALEFYLGLATREHVVPRIEMFRRESSVPILRLFSSNRLGMFVSGHWSAQQLDAHERAGRIRYGVASIPTLEGDPAEPVLYASGWAVPHNAPHRRWAVQVAAFLSGDIAQRIRARAGLEIPATPAVANALAAQDTTGREAAFLDIAARGRHTWGARVEKWREVEDVLLDLLDRPLVRGEPVAEVARELAARIDALLMNGR